LLFRLPTSENNSSRDKNYLKLAETVNTAFLIPFHINYDTHKFCPDAIYRV
jgi:hypothetical protein